MTPHVATSGHYAIDDDVDAWIEALPDLPAVFLIHPHATTAATRPYLARTTVLRRRMRRLLSAESTTTHRLSLRGVAARVEYRLTASQLEASLTYYEWARAHFPEDYARLARLRPAPFIKVLLANEFPRTTVTTRLSSSGAFQFGPFRTRAEAEGFEQEALNLFQLRRCQEDLVPAADHPGCVYGEMGRCLRPCQMIVNRDEYASEATRVVEFLASGGASLLHSLAAQRERLSKEERYEEAGRVHERYARVEQTLKLRDELSANAETLCGVAVLKSAEPGTVALRFMVNGVWLNERRFSTATHAGEMIPMDRRLRELVATLEPVRATAKLRTEHIALLTRWFYSSWRDGAWLGFTSFDELPYRRLVRAISTQANAPE